VRLDLFIALQEKPLSLKVEKLFPSVENAITEVESSCAPIGDGKLIPSGTLTITTFA